MIDFSPTTEHESITHPGEKFTTRRIGPALRASIELKLSADRARQREVFQRFFEAGERTKTLISELGTDTDGAPKVAENPGLITDELKTLSLERITLDDEYALREKSILRPAWLKAGFISLANYPKVTADALIESAPEDLTEEIYQIIYKGAYIDPDAAKTQPSSTTSAAAEDGKTSSTTAGTAKSTDTIPEETAPGNTPTN